MTLTRRAGAAGPTATRRPPGTGRGRGTAPKEPDRHRRASHESRRFSLAPPALGLRRTTVTVTVTVALAGPGIQVLA